MNGYQSNTAEKLYELTKLIFAKKADKQLIISYETYLKEITPEIVMLIVDKLILENYSVEEIKPGISKTLNVFEKYISEKFKDDYSEFPFFRYLVEENKELLLRLNEIKPLLKKYNPGTPAKIPLHELKERFNILSEILIHYDKKENILFPMLEKYFPEYRCVSIMWSMDDDVRKNLDSLLKCFADDVFDYDSFMKKTGKLYFDMFALVFREEKILFPVINKIISRDVKNQMFEASFEIGFSFIKAPAFQQSDNTPGVINDKIIRMPTGNLNINQLVSIFNNLPCDISFVDENDEVQFYSDPPHRVFTRTKAVIGRKVQNCHPPESVHIVNQILDSFRNGTKENADFWINFKGRTLLIRYFAIRNERGIYKGTLEVTQDITYIKTIEGEKRLLDW